MDRLQHDAVFAIAQRVLASVRHLLREEEHRDAFDEFVTIAREGIEAYARAVERRNHALRPGQEELPR